MGRASSHLRAKLEALRRYRTVVEKESLQELIDVMQTPVGKGGNLPVDTGFLRNSLIATTGSTVPVTTAKPPNYAGGVASETSLVIAMAKPGEPIIAAYTANYAVHAHWGAQGRSARPWVSLAVQRYPQIVTMISSARRSHFGL